MSDKNNESTTTTTDDAGEQEETVTVKMSDDLIAIIRELVQLTIMTGTNVVDHLRAVVCEIDLDTNKLIPTEEYVEAYNVMVGQLVEKAEAAAEALDATSVEGISVEDLAAGKFGSSLITGDGGSDDVN